ncbi:unnamed protein product [Symbiodinium necroappetens]|uniref:Uncharacterized protein n=1 Tax=Symbiodinium necroappetens TaxID=1628268 RepID=A0A812YBY0_9DINO|nr:unnamed protein product [Symbiodinium necroappetens]
MSTDEANSWCRAMLLALVPPLLHARMGITRRGWFLPYMYGTVKAKCFGSGPDAGKHVCNKPGHSCLRRIVSYATWKARRSWRAAGRALSFIAQSVLLTDEVPSLKQARPFMAEGLERLQPCREVHVCDRCHGPCEGLQGIVADAGQFFEAVQVPDACEAADRVLNLAELDGHSSASRADRKTEAKQAEDRLMAEMQKMRAELARKTAEPSTPKRRSTRHPEVQWTPKIHAHLQSLCAFMCNGEKIHLVDASRVHGWEDIQEQLQAHSAPTLKKYLATKVPASEVPRTKPAIIAAIVALVSEAVRV